jgi:hypothetical protein
MSAAYSAKHSSRLFFTPMIKCKWNLKRRDHAVKMDSALRCPERLRYASADGSWSVEKLIPMLNLLGQTGDGGIRRPTLELAIATRVNYMVTRLRPDSNHQLEAIRLHVVMILPVQAKTY